MKRILGGLVVSIIAVCLSISQVHAQDESSATSLGDVVITATKEPTTAGNVTQKVDIIDEADIRERVVGNGNIAEILSYEPGYFASVLSRNDANWGSAGGLAQNYKSYLLDGLPIDNYVDLQSLDPWSFERIENQRGPASVLYPNYLFMDFSGNQAALAGTTNLILKDYIKDPRTEFEGYIGSYNTYGARAFTQQRLQNFHFFAGLHHESSDYTNYGTEDSWLNMIDDPEYEKTKGYIRGAYFINDRRDHKLDFFAHTTSHEGDTGRPNREYDHQYSTIQAGYAFPIFESASGKLKIGYRDYERVWQEDNYPPDLSLSSTNGVDQTIVPMDLAFSIHHLKDSQLTVGADYQSATYETYSQQTVRVTGNDAEATQLGFYAQEELVLDELVLRLGGRFDHIEHDIDLLGGVLPGEDNQSWDKFLWSAGVKYALTEKFRVYSNVATSFMAPSLKSVGGTIALSDLGVSGVDGHLPNPDLEPEKGLGVDVGFDFQVAPQLFMGVRGFFNQIDDQIVQIVVSENPSQSQDINAAETRSIGVELEVRHQPTQWFEWFANYTFTETQIYDDTDPDQDGAEVPFVPQHMGNLGAHFNLPYDITASVYLQLAGKIYDSTSKQSRREFSSYELLNASVEKLLLKRNNMSLSVFADLYNITDNEFEMPWQFQDTGFSATGGIRLIF